MLARMYLRASSADQGADRARSALEAFAAEKGLTVAGSYAENETGASLDRPELWRLLRDSRPGDVILTEQVDRLSRLSDADWRKLRAEIEGRQLRVVALDLPTSHMLTEQGDEFTARMASAVSAMMLDMLAAIARKDYADRRRRAAEGIARAKEEGKYRGRAENVERNTAIAAMLRAGISWNVIQSTGCSRDTIARVAARVREEPTARGVV